MTWADTHGRFGSFVDDVIAGYPVTSTAADPTWWVGAEHLSRNDNHRRIVAWFTEARTLPPARGAISRTDREVARRVLRAHFAVWAASAAECEHMIHALTVAIDSASGESNNTIADLREVWFPPAGILTADAFAADISLDLAISVLVSDLAVITAAAAPGDGTAATVGTSLIIGSTLDDAPLPDVTTTEAP